MSNDQSFKNREPAMGKADPGTIKRIFSYIFQYKLRVIAIVVCILIGAAAQAGSALFLQSLIDTYILPMVGESNPDWAPLLRAISLMGCLYVAGIVTSWAWQWLIITVEQGTLKKIRDDMFAHQQKLPIRYFDSHEHGDIMSHYTNDTDTLRQAISQSFPQMFSSIISAIAALLSMLWLSIPFTAFVIVFTVLLYFIVRKIVSRSGRYFVKQQQWIGDVNAFVEESVNGQKVIKVFNHEDATRGALRGVRRGEHLGQRHHAGRRQYGIPAVHPARHRRRRRLVGRRQRYRSDWCQAAHPRYARLLADPVPFVHQPDRSGFSAADHGDDGARRCFPYLQADG